MLLLMLTRTGGSSSEIGRMLFQNQVGKLDEYGGGCQGNERMERKERSWGKMIRTINRAAGTTFSK
ncbi:hypothetical protein BBD42_12785 [Paenibacillus sp. BIHB 4019]|uniref:Uncharacterized protein n=1 Tax=Paenibacillus sp. BIHB 4019 TaxID=1870819 RepID=A0A1B2DHS8_9BACL|nr:hypothetical protein BBD42_12785 [Paenibacillus sp. BIHB 4019]